MLRLLPVASLLFGLALARAFAQSPAAESDVARRAHALAEDLMSPYCPGRTLADCPSPEAGELRAQVRTLLARGTPEREVRAELERRYGDAVQGIPRSPFAQAVPVVLLSLGLALLALVLLRLSPGARASKPRASAAGDLERALDADLRSRGL